ncbi:hypothetical protein DFH07DRAFT_693797, partial [Mycena maculata]
ELITEIFVHCLPTPASATGACFFRPHFVRPSVKDAPLLLCQICRRWRAIALTTPQLW